MNEKDHIKAELRAVREELVRRDLSSGPSRIQGSLLSPPGDTTYARLTQLETSQLKEHEERLERDLADINHGFETDDHYPEASENDSENDE